MGNAPPGHRGSKDDVNHLTVYRRQGGVFVAKLFLALPQRTLPVLSSTPANPGRTGSLHYLLLQSTLLSNHPNLAKTPLPFLIISSTASTLCSSPDLTVICLKLFILICNPSPSPIQTRTSLWGGGVFQPRLS